MSTSCCECDSAKGTVRMVRRTSESTCISSTTRRRALLIRTARTELPKFSSHTEVCVLVLHSLRRRVESPGRAPAPTKATSDELSICTTPTPPSVDEWSEAHGSVLNV